MSRPLTPAERRSYTHIPTELHDAIRIRPLLWMPGSFQGITLGNQVWLTTDEPDDGTSRLIAHELVHVKQYAETGIPRFFVNYLRDFAAGLRKHRAWMAAYRDIPVEVEARALAGQWLKRRAIGL